VISRYSDARRDAANSRSEVGRISNTLLQITDQRDSLEQQLELTRDSLSTVQQECSRLREELAAAGVATQLVEQERDRLLAQSLKVSEAAREPAAPHLPSAVENELAHLRQAITETLGEQALSRLMSRPRRGATPAYTSEGRGLDYSSAMTAAYAASDPRVSITTSSPAVSVTDTPVHPSWVEGRRSTGMESPVSTTRAVATASTPFSVRSGRRDGGVTSTVRTGTLYCRSFPCSPHVAHVSCRSVYLELQHTLFAPSDMFPV